MVAKYCLVMLAMACLAGCASINDTRPADWPVEPSDDYLSTFTPLPECSGPEVGRIPEPLDFELLPYGLDDNDIGYRSANRRMARLTRDSYLRVRMQHDETGEDYFVHILVPAGYVTDFASIPRISRLFFSSLGRHAEAAVAHDWLYAFGYRSEDGGEIFADRVFHQAVIDAGEWGPGRIGLWLPMRIWPATSYRQPQEQRFVDQMRGFRPTPQTAERLRRESVRICAATGSPEESVESLVEHLAPIAEATPPISASP